MRLQELANGIEISDEDINMEEFDSKGDAFEFYLYNACKDIATANKIAGGNADIEFMLNIVGSYIISTKDETIDLEDMRGFKRPAQLFDENFFSKGYDIKVPEALIEEKMEAIENDNT